MAEDARTIDCSFFSYFNFLYGHATTSIICTLYNQLLASSHSIAYYIRGGCWGKLSIFQIKSIIIDWSVLQECNDASIAVSLWEKLLFSVVANFIPSKIAVTQSKPWYSAYLHRLARTRDRLFCRAKVLESSSHCMRNCLS